MSVRALLSLFAVSSALVLGACSNTAAPQIASAGPALEQSPLYSQFESTGN